MHNRIFFVAEVIYFCYQHCGRVGEFSELCAVGSNAKEQSPLIVENSQIVFFKLKDTEDPGRILDGGS